MIMSASCEPPPATPAVKEEGAPIGPYPVQPMPKMPISELLELGTQMGFDVNFEVVSESGQPHDKTFIVNCTAGEFTSIGSGSAKKKAKHAAAAATLEKIRQSPNFRDHIFSKTSKAALAPHMNSVGRLQEVTMKKGWKTPEYSSLTAEGPPHMRQFETQVVVGTITAIGKGRNKKESKRSAAAAMLDNLVHTNLSLQPPAKKISFQQAGGYDIKRPPIVFQQSTKDL